ncbi:uncharacterized protein LOC132305052 [Cornus florida]|uniref:uncharacterized protein LOC132305052 n=1 Tax=Cornus florida TaxID=4283 RepID=UPI0028A1A00D|nr:uncharacterized protein LOC132305052 [Cornus florida]
MSHFVFVGTQSFISVFLNPKCLFIVGNVIVVILVRESKLAVSRPSPATEIYDEYVRRSQALRKASTYKEKKEEGKLTEKLTGQEKKNSIETGLKKKNMQTIERDRKGDRHREEEEPGLPVQELNKRVEDFIARVNKQRWLEEYRL